MPSMSLQYVKIPYQLLEYDGFNHRSVNMTKYLYVALLKHRQGNSSKVTVSTKVLEKITGIKRTNITVHINRLIKHGFVERHHQVYGWNQFGINTYTLKCPEDKFAMIPYYIAYDATLSKRDVIAYANIKRIIDLRRTAKKVFGSKEKLAKELQCTENNVDKIKRRLKEAGLISFRRESNLIKLLWEQDHFSQVTKNQK